MRTLLASSELALHRCLYFRESRCRVVREMTKRMPDSSSVTTFNFFWYYAAGWVQYISSYTFADYDDSLSRGVSEFGHIVRDLADVDERYSRRD